MAYTEPTTLSVGQILTASYLNTYLRNNMRYLKGTDGPVSISDSMYIGPASAATEAKIKIGYNSSGDRYAYADFMSDDANVAAYGYSTRFIRSPGTNGGFIFDHHGTGLMEYANRENADHQWSVNNIARMRLSASGLGIGTTSPQGRVHTLDTSGRGIVFVSGVITTSATTIISGIGISAGAAFIGSIRTASNGWFTASGGIASGSSNYIWNNGGTPNALTMSVTSSSVSMTSGGTSPVTLTVIGWLYYF